MTAATGEIVDGQIPGKSVSLVIPVYYNAESLAELHKDLRAFEKGLEQRGLALEIVFINDGSGDASLAELLKIKEVRPLTKIISLSRNFGAVAASKAGFQFVTGDCFMILSADLQEPIEQLLLMVDAWLAGHKFVVSVRASRADPLQTRFFAWLYYQLLEWMVVKGYPKGGFDLMLLDKSLLPYMRTSTKSTNPNLYAFWLGITPRVFSYNRGERRYGRSRWTFSKKIRGLLDTFTGFSATPVRLVSAFGVVVALLSFLYGVIVVVSALVGSVPIKGFATLAVLISFFSGLILIMLGMVGEYLWRVLDAVNNRPESVIDETFL